MSREGAVYFPCLNFQNSFYAYCGIGHVPAGIQHIFMLFVTISFSLPSLFQGHVACHNFTLTSQFSQVLDCKTVSFFVKISNEIGKAWHKHLTCLNMQKYRVCFAVKSSAHLLFFLRFTVIRS